MKKKLLSALMAFAMVLTLLPATTLAADHTLDAGGVPAETETLSALPTYEEAAAAIVLDSDKSSASVQATETLYGYNFFVDEVSQSEITAFTALESGSQLTVSNAGSDPKAYVIVYMRRYTRVTDPQNEYCGKYFGDITLNMHLSQYDFDNTGIPAGDGLYWVEGGMFLSINAGRSVTFTLPDDGSDTIYQLYTEIYYPQYDNQSYWRLFNLKIDDELAAPAPVEPEVPTKPETPPTQPTVPAQPEKKPVNFADVKPSAYYYDAVQWALEKGITDGTSATTFSPAKTCTTGQILTFLWRAVGEPEPTIANPFTNIKSSAYYYKAALWAYEKGMVTGTTFAATSPCTRASSVKFLWQLAGSPAVKTTQFTDVAADADYAQAVAWALEMGITDGTSDTTFSPDKTCTRGQIVTFLYRDLVK